MKYFFPVAIAALLVIACNSSKEKNNTEDNISSDSAKTIPVSLPDSNQAPLVVADSIPVPGNRLIVPGKSIGLTSLGQKGAEALQHLGKPSNTEAAMGGKELATWYSKPVIRGTDTVINETEIFFTTQMGVEDFSRVRHIRITSAYFSTAAHSGAGSSFEQVQKEFPGIKKIATYTSPKTKRQVTIYDDGPSGIAFEMDNGTCVGISVHTPGEQSYQTYNALFNDVHFLE